MAGVWSRLRGNSRSARLARNSVYMVIIKGISILISFLYVPLLIDTFDTDNYAVWLTLTSIVSWVALFDVGIGNGLRNKLAESVSRGDMALARRYVTTAYLAMGVVVVLLFAALALSCRWVDWGAVIASGGGGPGLNHLTFVVFSGFLFQFFFGLVISILLALQKPAMSALVTTGGQLLSYIGVVTCVKLLSVTGMTQLAYVISFAPAAVSLLFSIYLFGFRYRALAPAPGFYDRRLTVSLFSIGVQFFVIQIITIVLFQSNNLILTHVLDADAVVQYNIAYKYMYMLVILFNIIATPVWSAATDAWTRRDLDWIRRAKKRLLQITALLSAAGGCMVLASGVFYRLWLGDKVSVPLSATVMLYLYSVFVMLYGCYGYILNGIGKLRVQIVVTGVVALLYVPLAVVAGRMLGLTGVLIIFTLTAITNFVWSNVQYTKLLNGDAKGIWDK